MSLVMFLIVIGLVYILAQSNVCRSFAVVSLSLTLSCSYLVFSDHLGNTSFLSSVALVPLFHIKELACKLLWITSGK